MLIAAEGFKGDDLAKRQHGRGFLRPLAKRLASFRAAMALTRLGITSELIPPESYFGPTSDEREERVEVIFREAPARTGFRK
jgi:hypothetical protein